MLSNLRKAVIPNSKKGFTLIEFIIVMIILSIIAAVIVPSVVGFIWHGQQISRMNTARSLYISIQNQLTRHMLEGNLRGALTGDMYETDANDQLIMDGDYFRIKASYAAFNVEHQFILNGGDYTYPATDAENAPYVYYVQIPRDYNPNDPPPGTNEVQRAFYRLLDEVIIDKDILNGAFLMEFNIRTGVILSIFYGDNTTNNSARSRQELFGYGEGFTQDTLLFNWGDGNIVGGRGMEGSPDPYNYAFERSQGYYGVNWTGEPWDIPLPDVVNIFDGTNKQLEGRENVLYAELYVPKNRETYDIESYTLELVDNSGNSFEGFTPLIIGTDEFTSNSAPNVPLPGRLLNDELFEYSGPEELIYFPVQTNKEVNLFGIDISDSYDLFIWVLDCVYGAFDQPFDNRARITRYSIFNGVYPDVTNTDLEEPQFIRAKLTRVDNNDNEISAVSLRSDHSHYGGELPNILSTDRYELKSARHLNYIRYYPEAHFIQSTTIDMEADEDAGGVVPGAVINFEPIADFSGNFNGLGPQRVLNLNIIIRPSVVKPNIGLFANMFGTAEVRGLSIHGGNIGTLGNSNVGAIVGLMEDNSRVTMSYSYANVMGGRTPACNTGGLVGEILGSAAVLEQSFTAGFYDTNPIEDGDPLRTETPPFALALFDDIDAETLDLTLFSIIDTFGSVRARGGNIGGLVGKSNGTIRDSFNNARVNIEDVSQTEHFVEIANKRLDRYLLSVDLGMAGNTDLAPGMASSTFLGGIVGENTGAISNTYATNFVAIYETLNSGGIAGRVTGSTVGASNLFLENGCNNNLGNAVSKPELIDSRVTLGNMFRVGNVAANIYLDETEGFNEYSNYPYPILRNNQFLLADEDELWGWEEILGDPVISLAALAYYEIYSSNVYNRIHSSRFLTETIVAAGSPEMVIHDGYSIEFSPNRDGYLLQFGEDFYKIVELTGTGWRMLAFDADNDVWFEDDTWLPAETFTPDRNLPENYDGEDMFRIYIPNHLALKHVNSPVDVTLYPDAEAEIILGVVQEDNILGDAIATGTITDYIPLFANFSRPTVGTGASIRSPRHLDNINLADSVPDPITGTFTQHLNIDFELNYYNELTYTTSFITDTTSLRVFNQKAVIYREFAGTFVGTHTGLPNTTGHWIDNLIINRSEDDVGLFAVNSGTIRNVTLRNPDITGRTRVGAIAGTNSGTIRSCSVQQSAENVTVNEAMIQGTSFVGGIAGSNSGTINDVIVVSTSIVPSVQGVTGTSIGGIVGHTSTAVANVNRLIYLAVAPATNDTLRPYHGTGQFGVGSDVAYLAGSIPIRPYLRTVVDNILYSSYNMQQGAAQPGGRNTWDMHLHLRTQPTWGSWSANWSMQSMTLTRPVVETPANPINPYPMPLGTVPPESYVDWPLVIAIDAFSPDIVYYEVYADGTTGIFTRYFETSSAFPPNTIRELDLLNPNGIVLEAGYALRHPGNSGNQTIRVAQGMTGPWLPFASGAGLVESWRTLTPLPAALPAGTNLKIIPFNLLVNNFPTALDPARQIYFWQFQGGGNPDNDPVVAAFNPFFAKELNPVRHGGGAITYAPPQPTEHFIRTPWQMQQISRVTNYTGSGFTLANGGSSAAHTFIQELNLNFGARPVGGNFTSATELYNGTTAVVTTTTANIVRGTFAGIYNGNSRTISNLTLTGPTANNKGLFGTIGTAAGTGVVRNLTLTNFNISGGSLNGGFAFSNQGRIQNSVLINPMTQPQPVNGTLYGGIVYQNSTSGWIENTLFIAESPGTGGNPVANINTAPLNQFATAYYLSGTISGTADSYGPALFNTPVTIPGTPVTTQEINAMMPVLNSFVATNPSAFIPWRMNNVPTTVNTMSYQTYPYPFLGGTAPPAYWGTPVPVQWPVATIPASALAYYEIYSGGTMGFAPNPTGNANFALNNNLSIIESGYCAIVPRPGSYSVKSGADGYNTVVSSSPTYTSNGTSVTYVVLNNSAGINIINSGTYSAVEVYINDHQINNSGTSARFINTLFARGVYTTATPAPTFYIRTPQQIQNIGIWTVAATNRTTGVTFTQDRNIDFSSDIGGSSFVPVTGTFYGTYSGSGYNITDLSLNAVTANVGLFSYNAGVISNLTFNFNGTGITGSAANASIGAVAGTNSGTISGITLNLSDTSSITGTGAGVSVGGIVGVNTGTVSGILVVFNDQSSISASAAGSYVGSIAGANISASAVVSDLTVVSNLIDDVTPDPNAVVPVSGDQAGGVVGNNSGTITRILYLAPAPVSTDDDAIYPIVFTDTGTSDITETYFLAGENAEIIAATNVILSDTSYVYDLSQTPAEYGIYGDTGSIIDDIAGSWVSDGWTDTSPAAPPYTISLYPYPSNIGSPTSWPVVNAPLPPEFEPASSGSSTSSTDTADTGDTNNTESAANAENTESATENAADSSEGVVAAAGAVTLLGGYGFTKTEPFKSLIRRSNARAVRRINEYNDKKRRK